MKIPYFSILCFNMFCWLVRRLKVTKHLIFSSYFLAAVPARCLFWVSKGMLAQKLVTLHCTGFHYSFPSIDEDCTDSINKTLKFLQSPTIVLTTSPCHLAGRSTMSGWRFCKKVPLGTRLHNNYSCTFCHTDFINQEDVIRHMKIYS